MNTTYIFTASELDSLIANVLAPTPRGWNRFRNELEKCRALSPESNEYKYILDSTACDIIEFLWDDVDDVENPAIVDGVETKLVYAVMESIVRVLKF